MVLTSTVRTAARGALHVTELFTCTQVAWRSCNISRKQLIGSEVIRGARTWVFLCHKLIFPDNERSNHQREAAGVNNNGNDNDTHASSSSSQTTRWVNLFNSKNTICLLHTFFISTASFLLLQLPVKLKPDYIVNNYVFVAFINLYRTLCADPSGRTV